MSKLKTLVVFYPGCVEYEIMLAAELLNKTSPVDVATPDGSNHEGSNGMTYRASYRYSNALVEQYGCILIPGGGNVESAINDESLALLLQAGAKRDVVLAAICAGPLFLAKAGLLRGKQFTHGFGDKFPNLLAPFWKGAEFRDEPLVTDGNLITAKPEAHIDFAVAVARKMGAIPTDERAEYFRNLYKGVRT